MMPRRVDFLRHKEDLQVLVLGQLGFSTEFISVKTGLTKSQVMYRLQKRGVLRSDYRNGVQTDATVLVLTKVERTLSQRVKDQLRQNGEKT